MHVVCCSVFSRTSAEVSLDPVVSQGDIEEASQPSDKSNVPSTSQEPSSSSAGKYIHYIHVYIAICLAGTTGLWLYYDTSYFNLLIPLHSLQFDCCAVFCFCLFVFLDTSSAPPRPPRPGPSRQLQRWPENRGGHMKRGGKRKAHTKIE